MNGIEVDETVWKGGKFAFESGGDGDPVKATLAVILWTRGKARRPAVAELSFRIKAGDARFTRNLAEAARSAYGLLQRLSFSRPNAITKTEYVYRDAPSD